MNKLTTKAEVIERYWLDYLVSCIRWNEANRLDRNYRLADVPATVDGFWGWYITDGPLGLKHRGLFYSEKDIEYV